MFLSMQESAPFVTSVHRDSPGETELFQLFSLMMQNINVGKQLETLEKTGSVMIDALLDDEHLRRLDSALGKDWQSSTKSGHEFMQTELLGKHTEFAKLATHPIIMQIMKRVVSPSAKISSLHATKIDSDFVRKELEETTWFVDYPYNSLEFPGTDDGQMSLTAMWFLDELHAGNCTWAWTPPPPTSACHNLPHLSSSEEIATITKGAKTLQGRSGAVWLYLGPNWKSNNVDAASFWKDYDAVQRYASGQKTFRAVTDDVVGKPSPEQKPELCHRFLQATYVREFVVPQDKHQAPTPMSDLSESEQKELLKLLP